VPVVMISGHGTIDTAVSAIKTGAYDFIEKPFKADRLLLVVDRAIEADRLRRENATLRRRAGGEVTFVGSSSAATSVRSQIERVAQTGSRVLISGASGAGKETVARLIHQGSKRADGPFVVVNCSALPAERLELELFGTDGEGASDALRVTGAFEMAHGGTLVLKEVADLPCRCRAGSPACCRSSRSRATAARHGSRSTCAFLPRPLMPCRKRAPREAFAKSSSIA
jgi:two-component system, NtrC family, nitrogen regulation response regulator NtrX